MRAAEGHMRDTQAAPTLDAVAEPNRPLLELVLPDLSAELAAGLVADGRPELAEQIPQLRISERCGCGDSFCTSFYVGPRPGGAWSDEGEHESLMADVNRGMVVLMPSPGRSATSRCWIAPRSGPH